MPKILTSLCAAAIAFSPLAAMAAPGFQATPGSAPSHVLNVDGWWEQEHRADNFRDRYWQLPPEQRARYDQLEFQIRRLQDRQRHEAREGDRREYYQISEQIEQMRREQYRIMRFWE